MFHLFCINLTHFVFLQEAEHSQQVCSNEAGDIATKKKSKCKHLLSPPFREIKRLVRLFTQKQSEHHQFAQWLHFLSSLMRRHLSSLLQDQADSEDPRGREGHFNGLHSLGWPPLSDISLFFRLAHKVMLSLISWMWFDVIIVAFYLCQTLTVPP